MTSCPKMPPSRERELEQLRNGNHAQQASKDSGQFTNTKGLLNGPGQNNCFLNSAVQVLWHLDIFRRSFRELSGHACMAESCIFCALKELFSQLQFSHESALPPDALRRALAETFFDQQRFQLGFMDDASECFENILLRIHFHIANEEAEDMCNAKHCIPHQKFAMTLVEQSVCGACGATSEPLPFTQMVHYVSASALTDQARQMSATNPQHSDLFGQLLRRAGGMGDIRDCPSNCGAKIQICRSLTNRPEIVSVGIVWDSERPTLDQIMSVFAAIGTTLRLGDVFHSVVDQRWALNCQHTLVGVVTYYGKHYSTFFFHTKLRLWIYFDDANVREVGPRWEQVVEKCRRGRYQPLLLLYAALNGTSVSTQDAPKFVTMVSNLRTNPVRSNKPQWNYQKTMINNHTSASDISPHLPPLSPGRRSITPSPEKNPNCATSSPTRRAITPNPDTSSLVPQLLNKPTLNDYQNLSDMQALIMMKENAEPNYISRRAVENVLKGQAEAKNTERNRTNSFNGLELARSNSMSRTIELSRSNSSLDRKRGNPVQRSCSTESERSSVFRAGSETDSVRGGFRTNSESDSGNYSCTGLQRTNSSGGESVNVADHLNVPRRRDSGNWSGDRNSASSSSSTSMENPYLYIVGKMHNRNGALPRSPISKTENGGQFDPGYDSYSLSSTDSLPLQQGLKHNLQLAKIPESRVPVSGIYSKYDDTPVTIGEDCEKLCLEADELLEKSQVLEEQHDLEGALALVKEACVKSRAAMDAPYNNPGNISVARMKHNSCVVRLRSIQRKIHGEKEGGLEARHSRENSTSSLRNSTSKISHSRQNSRESNKGQHSRQNSRETLISPITTTSQTKIRELLPQPVVGIHNLSEKPPPHKNIEIYATLPKKKGGVMSRVRSKNDSPTKNVIEDAEYLIYDRPGRDKNRGRDKNDKALSPVKEKRAKSEERKKTETVTTAKDILKKVSKEDSKGNAKNKQHKIRRKLLMGGLIKRKNRSMPDLREDQEPVAKTITQDDSSLKTNNMDKQLSGYLSEGHLEYAGSSTNPNLERSRLMRKSFHGSAGKVLHAAKVPPPPPLRTTSQLTKSDRPKYPLPNELNQIEKAEKKTDTHTLPFIPTYVAESCNIYLDDPVKYANSNVCTDKWNQVVTRAQVHEEPSRDEVDSGFPLPPYPSPLNSANHSRQPSEEFPLPPPPEDLLAPEPQNTLLEQLRMKKDQIINENSLNKIEKIQETSQTHLQTNPLLKELRAKIMQKMKGGGEDVVDFIKSNKAEDDNSVKNLTSKFEQIQAPEDVKYVEPEEEKKRESFTTSVLKLTGGDDDEPGLVRRKSGGKKKNVTFCDQVVLVATADDDQDDSFIPNPILERVLRSALTTKEQGSSPELYDPIPKIEPPKPVYQPPPQYQLRSVTTSLNNETRNQVQNNNVDNRSQVQNYLTTTDSRPQNQNHSVSSEVRPLSQNYHNVLENRQPNYPVLMQNSPPMGDNRPQTQSYQPQSHPPLNSMSSYYHSLENRNSVQSSENRSQYQNYQKPPIPLDNRPTYQISQAQNIENRPPSQTYMQPSETTRYNQLPPPMQTMEPRVAVDARYHPQSRAAPMQQSDNRSPYLLTPVQNEPRQGFGHPPETRPNYMPPPSSSPYVYVPQPKSQTVQKPADSSQQFLPEQKTPLMQRASMQITQNSPYQPLPLRQNGVYQMLPKNSVARVNSDQKPVYPPYYHPVPNRTNQVRCQETVYGNRTTESNNRVTDRVPNLMYPPYQQPPAPKTVSVNDKLGVNRQKSDSQVNDNTRTSPCHLCRKKNVLLPAIYCPDCDFYMSRFRPKT